MSTKSTYKGHSESPGRCPRPWRDLSELHELFTDRLLNWRICPVCGAKKTPLRTVRKATA